MSTRQIIERKERSLVELILIVVILGVMASVFINKFFGQEQQITGTAFESLAHSFASKVQVVHGQWLMDKQPNIVELSSWHDDSTEKVMVNKKGWIDTHESANPCYDIWAMAMSIPLVFMNQPIIVIEVERAHQAQQRVCRYSTRGQFSFDYSPDNGKVLLGIVNKSV